MKFQKFFSLMKFKKKFNFLYNFKIQFFYETPLNIAVGKEYLEIVKLLLSRDDINVNQKSVFTIIFLNIISLKFFFE